MSLTGTFPPLAFWWTQMLFTFKAIIYEPCCLATKVRCFMLSLTLTREFAEVWWLVTAAECRWFLTAGKWTVSWLFPSSGTSGMLWERNSCCFVPKTYCFSRFYCRHHCHPFMKVCDKLLLLKEPKNSGIYKTDNRHWNPNSWGFFKGQN